MAQKISVVIPNYNGANLLAKNLPQVIKNCPGCQIIVVDDASQDDSVNFIKTNFKKIKLIVNQKNLGFQKTVNRGANVAKGDLLLLLNSDVSPQKDFLKNALPHFNPPNVFAVGLCDLSHEDGKIVKRGRGGATFRKGFLNHFAQDIKDGETLWVSGGSGIFVKKIFQELGGFDPIYAPFYWEDIDLSFRARQKGYICIFEANSYVDHYHEEGAIKKTTKPFKIKVISYRNQFIFVWKNFSDPLFLLEHLLYLPYHLVKAALSGDWAFVLGFAKALAKIPWIVQNPQYQVQKKMVSERDVIKKFEKP